MTGRRGASGWRQVTSLLAAFGAGAVLVLAGGAFVPDLMRLPDPPPALASPWSRVADDASASRGGPDAHDGSAPPAPEPRPTSTAAPDPADGARSRDDGAGRGTPTPDADDRDGRADGGGDAADGRDAAADGDGAADADDRDGEAEAADGGDGRDDAGDGDAAREEPDAAEATSAPAAESGPAGDAAAVLALVNDERAAAGCPALRADGALDGLAAAHAADMRDRGYFDHTDPDGRTPWDRAAAAGVDGVGAENIARGQADAAAVVAAWMDSPGHRANILDCSLTRHGLGRADGSGGPWWVQVFGR